MQQWIADALSVVGAFAMLFGVVWIVSVTFNLLRLLRRQVAERSDFINRIEEIERNIHKLQQTVGGIQDDLDAFSDVPYQINTLATASNVQRKQIEKLSLSVNLLRRRVNRFEIGTTEEPEDEEVTE